MNDTPNPDDHLRTLADLLAKSRPDELTCDEWLDRVGSCAEAAAAGQPAPAGSDLVMQHLTICPECKEEYDALVAALREPGPSPSQPNGTT
jgi:hypothetical protein